MSDPAELRKTPLHDLHVAAGGRMVPFAGWRMPVQFSGVISEHNCVRTNAGLFDVSHMGEVTVRGAQALEYLQWITCNNVSRLQTGRAHYNALTTPEGTFVDDLLIYMLGENDYLLVINAGNTPKDLAWMQSHAADFDVTVEDVSTAWAQLALQGPNALEILQPLVDLSLAELKYYGFAMAEIEGLSCIVSNTGYTGEAGFEVYAPAAGSPGVWTAIMNSGQAHGLQPIGLAARDTLRLEAKMALYGNDIDDTTTVLEADLGWIVKFKKGDFIGRDRLAAQAATGIDRKLIGFEMLGRSIARKGYPTLHQGERVGEVTSGSFAPFLEKNIGLTYLPVALAEVGTEFEIHVRGRSERARVVPTPFYKRQR